jgi:hypothetical protein
MPIYPETMKERRLREESDRRGLAFGRIAFQAMCRGREKRRRRLERAARLASSQNIQKAQFASELPAALKSAA